MVTAAPKSPEQAENVGLKRNSISTRQVAVTAVAATGPAAGVAGSLALMAGFAGEALVLAFLFTFFISLLLTNTLAEFAKRLPSAGSLFSWYTAGLGPNVGFVLGWLFTATYVIVAVNGLLLFSAFAQGYLQANLSIDLPWWVYFAVGAAYVIGFAWKGVTQSIRNALMLLGIEITIMLALAIWLLLSGEAHLSLDPFKPSSSLGGWAGIGLAMTYGVQSLAGFEEAATLAEEAKEPRRSVPRGLWIAGSFTPLFFVFVSFMLVSSYGGSIAELAEDPTAAQTVATQAWHGFGGIITIVLLSSFLAFSQTAFNAAVRVVYSLSKADLVPAAFSRVHPRHETPSYAIIGVSVLALGIGVALAASVGVFNAFAYNGFTVAVSFLAIYAVINVALVRFMLLKARSDFSLLRHAVIPALAFAGMAYPLYRTVSPLPPSPFDILPWIVVGWLVIGVGVLIYLRSSRRVDVDEVGALLAGEAPR